MIKINQKDLNMKQNFNKVTENLNISDVDVTLHYTIIELDNMVENANFVINHYAEIDIEDWMTCIINLADDCKRFHKLFS